MDGSRRSVHSNAFLFGFWNNKRIVLFDTLLSMKHSQILAILGHELGHWQRNHTIKGIMFSFAHLFILYTTFSFAIEADCMYSCFGYLSDPNDAAEAVGGATGSKPALVGLYLFSQIFTPVDTIFGVLSTIITRKHEYEADGFAVQLGLGEELRDSLLGLHKENLGELNPDWMYAWYNYSHPALLERLNAVEVGRKKEGGGGAPARGFATAYECVQGLLEELRKEGQVTTSASAVADSQKRKETEKEEEGNSGVADSTAAIDR
eukprot:GHVU01203457.1.p1 GENE.GHVU01203457.1~~GHVU01203457.1.p1  ORF type:complete len:263 (-),score=60.45 GHVU01203457.1:107-895(-)